MKLTNKTFIEHQTSVTKNLHLSENGQEAVVFPGGGSSSSTLACCCCGVVSEAI